VQKHAGILVINLNFAVTDCRNRSTERLRTISRRRHPVDNLGPTKVHMATQREQSGSG